MATKKTAATPEPDAPTFKPAPAAYRRMCEPHESLDAFNDNLNAFIEEVGALRQKYRLANLITIIQGFAIENGTEGEYFTSHSWGDSTRVSALCAYAYGQAQQEHSTKIAGLLRGKK